MNNLQDLNEDEKLARQLQAEEYGWAEGQDEEEDEEDETGDSSLIPSQRHEYNAANLVNTDTTNVF